MSDFQLALAQLRGNAAIDYTQLGLHFKLQAWEVSGHLPCAEFGHQAVSPGIGGTLCSPGVLLEESRVLGSSKVLPWPWDAIGVPIM